MDERVIAGLLLAVGCALAGSVAVLLKQRGAVTAPIVLARHPIRSAIGLFRCKWWTVGWLVARLVRLRRSRPARRAALAFALSPWPG